VQVQELNDPPPLTDPADPRAFSSVISGLQKSYPKEKLEEISTSFCFICLLHLANEKGLRLESVKDNAQVDKTEIDEIDETEIGEPEAGLTDNVVGELWDLRVCQNFKKPWRLLFIIFCHRCLGTQTLRMLHKF